MNRQTEESTPAQPPRHVFRALHHRNYRLFFFGQGVSVIGTWMQRVALSWLVYVLTGDPFLLGVVNFSNQIPAALVAPFAGVLADRMDRRRLLIATQSLAMAQAFVLAALTLLGQVAIWHIILLGVLLGLVNGLDMPIRQSFVVNMVGRREDLPNAIALNSFIFNAAMLLGPSLGGLVLHYLNAGICFLINGISFAAVLAALVAMRVEPTARPPTDKHVLIHLKEGLTYALGSPPIRAVLTLLIMISLLGRPYGVLLPIFAKDILAGDADVRLPVGGHGGRGHRRRHSPCLAAKRPWPGAPESPGHHPLRPEPGRLRLLPQPRAFAGCPAGRWFRADGPDGLQQHPSADCGGRR